MNTFCIHIYVYIIFKFRCLFYFVYIYACRFLATSNKLFPDTARSYTASIAVRRWPWSCDIDCIIWSSNGPPQNLSPWASWTWDGAKLGEIDRDPKKTRRWPEMSWWSHMFEQGVQKICVSLKMPGWYKLTSMFFCEPDMISLRL